MTYWLRGVKGLWWEPEQYLGWPELLAEAGYTFLMLCYSFCPESGLRWRRPFQPSDEAIVRRLAADCAARGLELCLAVNPGIGAHAWTPDRATLPFHPTSGLNWFNRYWQARRPGEDMTPDPPLRYGSDDDLAVLTAKLRRAADWGVRAFTLSLDDIDPGATPPGFASVADAQLWLVEGIRAALGSAVAETTPEAPRLTFTPTFYWSEGARAHADYTAEIRARLPADVAVYWTGERVRTPGEALTRASARAAARLFGRRPMLWFNYASNDSFRFALQLPPGLPPRDDLGDDLAGVLVNPMRQERLTRLHVLAMGEYLRDPSGYDHRAAVERAARRLVGDAAAPWLSRCAAAWSAYPDPRTLADDVERDGPPLVDDLLARLEPALANLDVALGELDARVSDGALVTELRLGAARYRLLVEALDLRRQEHDDGASAVEQRRQLETALAAEGEEAASDARVVLDATIP